MPSQTPDTPIQARQEEIASTLARFVRFDRSYNNLITFRVYDGLTPEDLQAAARSTSGQPSS
jgi:hypothetical protein